MPTQIQLQTVEMVEIGPESAVPGAVVLDLQREQLLVPLVGHGEVAGLEPLKRTIKTILILIIIIIE